MRRATIVAMACVALTGCHRKAQEQPRHDRPEGHFTIRPPIRFSTDPSIARQQQEQIVDSMVTNPDVDLDTLRGEAFRRGVTLTDDQISRKRAVAATSRPAAAASRRTP